MPQYIYPRKAMPVADLQPGDIVTPDHGKRVDAFDACVVQEVSDTFVTWFRPYGTHADYVYGEPPRVVPYIGIETYQIERTARALRYYVWSRLER